MDNKEIIQFCMEKGILLDKYLFTVFSESDEIDLEVTKSIIEKIGQQTKKRVITKNLFFENKDKLDKIFNTFPKESQGKIEKLKIKLGLSLEISKEMVDKKIDISSKSGVMGKDNSSLILKGKGKFNNDFFNNVKVNFYDTVSGKKLEVNDFVKYFRNRYNEISNVRRDRGELNNLISINKISGNSQSVSIIGMVLNKRVTKNKNLIIELEDLTGKINVLINVNKPELMEKGEEVALDSVIGVKGFGSREILFLNDIIFPDSIITERKKSPFEEFALFTGDLHIGANNFMESNFLKFIKYLNGDVAGTNYDEIMKIKYLFIVGDLIAGVGIYPGQENDLNIPDVEEQYSKAAELLAKIRGDITIILSPGNHDALRIMQPQPILDEKFAWPIYELKNVMLTGNPSLINIGQKNKDGLNFNGFNVLTYHGYSFHYYANNINYLMKQKAAHSPEKIMSYLLKNRHLAPTHSSTLYFPGEVDPLFIKEIPDIFFSGHTHKSALTYYKNILVISSSCWERKTAFQEKMGK